MSWELSKTFEKLEQIETSALEDIKEVSPLESLENNNEFPEPLSGYNVSFEGNCTCSGDCGGEFSRNGKCHCSGNCGNNSSKG